MDCPKCKSKKIQNISQHKFYCVNCNYAWDSSNGANETSGKLDFSGAITAKKIFEVLTKDQDLTPEFRAALETQITSIIFEQWFEGFKAGQMASILYAREFYGKDRIASSTTTREGQGRNGGPEEENTRGPRNGKERRSRPGQRRRAEDGGIERPHNTKIRKRIGPVELEYERVDKVPESMEKYLAYLSQEVWKETSWIKTITYNGSLVVEIKDDNKT
jgi:hypothetical protein